MAKTSNEVSRAKITIGASETVDEAPRVKITISPGGATKLNGERIGWTHRYTCPNTGTRGWRFDPVVGVQFKRLFKLTQRGIREELIAQAKDHVS